MKICKRCHTLLDLREFHRTKKSKDGHHATCANCVSFLYARMKPCPNCSKKSLKFKKTGKCPFCLERFGFKRCPSCGNVKEIAQFGKDSGKPNGLTSNCKPCTILHNSTPQRLEYQQQYRLSHRAEALAYNKIYVPRRKREDIQYKITCNLRSRLRKAIRKKYQSGKSIEELGCSMEYFIRYIESLWQPGMSWDNWSHSGWHLDHVRPLSSFDLTDPEQVKAACHYTNIQPLWAADNLKKGGNYKK